MCKIQKREYSIYRRVYFAMKGGWIMSEKKLRNITDVLSVFLCHLNWIVPPLWKSLTEHQKCQDQQPQNRLQKKAALLSIPVRDPMRIKMDRHPLRQISPGGHKIHHVPKDHQKAEHICNIPQFFLRHYPVEVTEENREHIFEIASKMMSVIKLLSIGVCLDAGISGNLGTAPMWPVWILITGIFVTLILGIRGIYKAGKETGMDEDDKS